MTWRCLLRWFTLALYPIIGPSWSVCPCVCLVASDIFTLKNPSHLSQHPRAIKALQGVKLAEMGHGNDTGRGSECTRQYLADTQSWSLLSGWPP